MEDFFFSILNLLTTSPGNLVYHLVVGFAVLSALQAVIFDKRAERHPARSRTILGLSLLVLSQFGQFLATGLAWQGLVDLHFFLPPLDRAFIAFSLVIVAWLWVLPKPHRVGDILTTLLLFATLLAFLLSLAAWSNQVTVIPFNGTWLDQYWVGAGALLIALALVSLVIWRPAAWGWGFAMLAVLLLGLAAQFFWFDPESDFSGSIRLAQLVTFPLLPALTLRFKQLEEQPAENRAQAPQPVLKERRKHSADPRAVHAWLQVVANPQTNDLPTQIARAVAQTMFADLCYLVTCPTSQDHLTLVGGYDLIREQALPPTQIERAQVSTIANAVTRGRSVCLGGEAGDSPDLPNLAREIGLDDCGNICLIPLAKGGQSWGAILLLSPYSNRNWAPEDQTYLSSSIETITDLLMTSPEAQRTTPPAEVSAEPTRAVVDELLQQLETLKQENHLLLNEISIMRQAETNTQPTDQPEASLRPSPSSQVEQLEAQLRQTQVELAHLQNLLADADQKSQRLSATPELTTSENREEILAIAQELRQPLASLTGYTDLILSESAGILGGLQRKFMERIRASTERMQSMIDELIQVTAHPGSIHKDIEPVPVSEVIDAVVTENRAQIQEKNITFQIDFPETLPHLNIERDAFEQIVSQLVQNAILISPYDGAIRLHCSTEAPGTASAYFLFQVTDQGGGVDPSDLPHVFSKRVKAEIPLIQGIGDRGTGLSIAKTLIEAHQGRIWVESDPGKTTTISILVPMLAATETET